MWGRFVFYGTMCVLFASFSYLCWEDYMMKSAAAFAVVAVGFGVLVTRG